MLNSRKLKIIWYASALFVTSGFLLGLIGWTIISDWDGFLLTLNDLWNYFVKFKYVYLAFGITILVLLCLVLFVKLYEAIGESEEAINESELG